MIENWWPTRIGYYDNPNHSSVQDKLVKECLSIMKKTTGGGKSWISDSTYNTSDGLHEVHKNKKFSSLNKWIVGKIKEYVEETSMIFKINTMDSWFNVYKQNDFQEFHEHYNSVISCVYFLKSNNKSCDLIIKSPTTDFINIKYKNFVGMNAPVRYKSIPGRLVVFRSYLPHCVDRQKNKDLRISLAYNFYW
tara:strand:- start:109 stop:684 length:576 start_codon:yes stop_codon:yes gene_type:complete